MGCALSVSPYWSLKGPSVWEYCILNEPENCAFIYTRTSSFDDKNWFFFSQFSPSDLSTHHWEIKCHFKCIGNRMPNILCVDIKHVEIAIVSQKWNSTAIKKNTCWTKGDQLIVTAACISWWSSESHSHLRRSALPLLAAGLQHSLLQRRL